MKLFLLIFLFSCATKIKQNEPGNYTVKYYSIFSNKMFKIDRCESKTDVEKFAWQRHKKISCKNNVLYISCDYPDCDKESFPCFYQSDLESICRTYPALILDSIYNY